MILDGFGGNAMSFDRKDLVGRGLRSVESGEYTGKVTGLDKRHLVMDDRLFSIHNIAPFAYSVCEPEEER